jgi:hypothetical protein
VGVGGSGGGIVENWPEIGRFVREKGEVCERRGGSL